MKLYITAAYLRKHSALAEIRAATNVSDLLLIDHSIRMTFLFSLQLQTTVYMSCGRCGKPILAQQGGSMCATCRSPAAQCSIWSVPFLFCDYILKRGTCPQPPSSKIYAFPVCRLFPRWPPSLLPAVLRRDPAGSPSSTTGAVARVPDEISSSSLPLDVDVAEQRQRVR